MTDSDIYKQIFDRLYSSSSKEERALFDNSRTRKRVPVLYAAWRDYQGKIKEEKHSKLETGVRDPYVGFNIDDFCFALDALGAALSIHALESEGHSREEAISTVARLVPPGSFQTKGYRPSRSKKKSTKK